MTTNTVNRVGHDRDTVRELVGIFTQVLEVPVDPDDIFVERGGDSLAAMSCIFQIHQAFGVVFTVTDFILDDATPRTLAARITNGQ